MTVAALAAYRQTVGDVWPTPTDPGLARLSHCCYEYAMPPQPAPEDKAARRRLAKRRCLSATRGTLAFIVLATPFVYFGYVLCCHMPFGFSAAIPKWMFFAQCWLFFRSIYLFFRNVWFAPFLAPLPFVLISAFIFIYPPPFPENTDPKLYFDLFYNQRMEIVRMIENGQLRDEDEFVVEGNIVGKFQLPQQYIHTSFPYGEIHYRKTQHGTSVFFPTSWNILSYHQGFEYFPDDTPSNWPAFKSIDSIERIAPCWYHLEY